MWDSLENWMSLQLNSQKRPKNNQKYCIFFPETPINISILPNTRNVFIAFLD